MVSASSKVNARPPLKPQIGSGSVLAFLSPLALRLRPLAISHAPTFCRSRSTRLRLTRRPPALTSAIFLSIMALPNRVSKFMISSLRLPQAGPSKPDAGWHITDRESRSSSMRLPLAALCTTHRRCPAHLPRQLSSRACSFRANGSGHHTRKSHRQPPGRRDSSKSGWDRRGTPHSEARWPTRSLQQTEPPVTPSQLSSQSDRAARRIFVAWSIPLFRRRAA